MNAITAPDAMALIIVLAFLIFVLGMAALILMLIVTWAEGRTMRRHVDHDDLDCDEDAYEERG